MTQLARFLIRSIGVTLAIVGLCSCRSMLDDETLEPIVDVENTEEDLVTPAVNVDPSAPAETDADLPSRLDEAPPAIMALPFGERVAEVGRVEVDGQTWVLSELPPPTVQRFIEEGVAGPDLDPLGGELLLLEGSVIVQAISMNAFPPSFVESDGRWVFAGRHGDGGYPDSAIVRVDVETGQVERIVFPFGTDPDPDPGPDWSIGSPEQFELFTAGSYGSIFE